ncbi:MAG: transketolase [Lentisphaeria bacterium]|jgi:transketolase
MLDTNVLQTMADTIRVLAAEGVQKANSGHPGMPMGCADFAAVLWGKHLRHDPANPNWLGRDRYVQSAGHGSMLLYSLLHLFNYGLTTEDLAQFRQWESKTPGHPEHGWTTGVEITTGPLGTGFASAVGMAIAAKQLAARTGCPALEEPRIYALAGDGCMMEGVTAEAASLAGHLRLDNLIAFYDDNQITIEGATAIAFSEDVALRFRAYGWNVLRCNGNAIEELDAALTLAKASRTAPSLIIGKTQIAHRAPTKAGTHHTHGEPLGADELAALKQCLGFPATPSFFVPANLRAALDTRGAELAAAAQAWNGKLAAWCQAHADQAALLDALATKAVPANLLPELLKAVPAKETATRQSGSEIMQRAAALVPALAGGSADLNPSTKTHLKDGGDFTAANRAGRNVHFGIREFAMGQIAIGMALHGSAIPFTATFAVFSDFMKPALRLAALQEQQVLFVYTHDSFYVGEDGPTHEPVEQLLMCRSIPHLTVLRPAESFEAAHAWAAALQHRHGPVCLFLTRQNVENIPEPLRANIAVAKGAYVLSDDPGFEAIVIATGSELMTTYRAVEKLRAQGRKIRLVSMPSCELFNRQDAAYRESVLPDACAKRVTVEAGLTLGWERYAGRHGLMIGLDRFGASAPAKVLAEKFGFTPDAIATKIAAYLA